MVLLPLLLASSFPNVNGMGLQSCTTWADHRRAGQPVDAYGASMTAWVGGFISGQQEVVLGDDEPRAAFAWIDTYCRDHPLDSLADASVQLVDALRARRRR